MVKRAERKSYDIGVVKWTDAHADSAGSWTTLSEIDQEPYIVTTVGSILPSYTKPDHISVVQSVGHGHIDGIIHIPNKMVQEITILGSLDVEDE